MLFQDKGRKGEYIVRMLEVTLDALKDSAIVVATVFVLHVLLSFFEGKIARILNKSRHFAPALGSLFGLVPECGTSVVGADLYQKNHLTMGTLVAIFLACSDEALPILFTDYSSTWYMSFVLLGLKVLIAMGVGFLVDILLGKKNQKVEEHLEECHGEEEVHVGCCGHEIEGTHENPWKEHLLHPFLHSLKIFVYVFVLNFLFGTLLYLIGEEAIAAFLSSSKPFSPLFAILIGLIPNCASSVMLANFYLNGLLPFGALLSGLLVNAGLGMFVLFKSKEKRKEAFAVLGICVAASLVFGYIFLYVF